MNIINTILAAMMISGLLSTAHAAAIGTPIEQYSVQQTETPPGGEEANKEKEEEPDC